MHSNSSASRSRSRSGSSRQGESRKRYKYCCRKCKHTESGRKSCLCVVPKSQRRTQLGERGCQTCDCKGCSIEDFISRGQDPQYKPSQKNKKKNEEQKFEKRNGCCRKCMKAFSKNNRSCICQVPQKVRKTKLPSDGCKICNCQGCNPKDNSESERSYSQESRKSSYDYQSINERQQNFGNIDKSAIGKIVIVEYGLFPGMLGLGIPQRTPSYILGKPL